MQLCQFRQFTFHWLYINFWQNMSFNQKFVSSTLLYHWHLCQWFTITDVSVMLKTVKQLFLVDMLYLHISRLFELDFLTVARKNRNKRWMNVIWNIHIERTKCNNCVNLLCQLSLLFMTLALSMVKVHHA